jgi:hypothetical protein
MEMASQAREFEIDPLGMDRGVLQQMQQAGNRTVEGVQQRVVGGLRDRELDHASGALAALRR